MKLGHAFRSSSSLWRRALQEGDTALLGRLMRKKASYGLLIASGESDSYKDISRETASFLAQNLTKEVTQRWGFHERNLHHSILSIALYGIVGKGGQPEIFDAFIGGQLPPDKLFTSLMDYVEDPAQRQGFLGKLLAGDSLADPHAAARVLVDKGFAAELDMLVAAGLDIHKDNESLLRYGAEQEKAEMCRHLVLRHGADIDMAIMTERTLGNEKIWQALEGIRTALRPDAPPPPSITELARDVAVLKATMAAMQESIAEITAELKSLRAPAAAIDKPALAHRSAKARM